MMAKKPVEPASWQNRIVGHGELPAEELLANPRNWRIHPKLQQDALEQVLSDIGWVEEITINKRTGFVVDGHLRASMALQRGIKSVPVRYVDLSEQEEAQVLATLDPISALAGPDKDKLTSLIADIYANNADNLETLRAIAKGGGLPHLPVLSHEDQGKVLAKLNLAIEDPKHETKTGDVWTVGDHVLFVADPMIDWALCFEWCMYAGAEGRTVWLVPYPGPFVVMSEIVGEPRMVLVQPSTFIAGHLLDRYAEGFGEDRIKKLGEVSVTEATLEPQEEDGGELEA